MAGQRIKDESYDAEPPTDTEMSVLLANILKLLDDMKSVLDRTTTGNLAHNKNVLVGQIMNTRHYIVGVLKKGD